MRRSSPVSYTAQAAFEFEEASFPSAEACQVQEAASPPLLTLPPDHISVYTVFLRRSDVFSVKERHIIRSPQDVAAILSEYLKETDREHFVLLLLDTKNSVIGITTVSIGILDSALVHPREVYKPAILANAACIILAHNHPSGDPTPSAEDRRITQRLHEAGQILGIEVLDHIIVGEKNRFVSLKERGVL